MTRHRHRIDFEVTGKNVSDCMSNAYVILTEFGAVGVGWNVSYSYEPIQQADGKVLLWSASVVAELELR